MITYDFLPFIKIFINKTAQKLSYLYNITLTLNTKKIIAIYFHAHVKSTQIENAIITKIPKYPTNLIPSKLRPKQKVHLDFPTFRDASYP